MKLPLVYALMLFAAGNLCGQIGQTEQATSAAFGKPLGSPHNSGLFKIATYRTTAYEITVAYKDGKTAYLIYKKNGGGDWTLGEVMGVLNANVPGGQGRLAKVDRQSPYAISCVWNAAHGEDGWRPVLAIGFEQKHPG